MLAAANARSAEWAQALHSHAPNSPDIQTSWSNSYGVKYLIDALRSLGKKLHSDLFYCCVGITPALVASFFIRHSNFQIKFGHFIQNFYILLQHYFANFSMYFIIFN